MGFYKRRLAQKPYIRRMNERRNIECPACFRVNYINFGEERIMRMKAQWLSLRELIDSAVHELKLLEQLYETRESNLNKGHEEFLLADRLNTDTAIMLEEIKKLKNKVSKSLP